MLLALVSPVAVLIAAAVFLASLVVVGIRLISRGPLRGPAIIAVVSLVAVVLFGGISQTLYGGDQPQETTDIREAQRIRSLTRSQNSRRRSRNQSLRNRSPIRNLRSSRSRRLWGNQSQ